MVATPILPRPELRPYVRQFLAIETEAGDISHILPDLSTVLGFRFQGRGVQETRGRMSALPNFVFAGMQNSLRRVTHAQGGMFLTLFTPMGASAFLRDPVDSVFNESLPFDCLVGEEALRPLEDRLFGASEHGQRAEAMEGFLMGQLRRPEIDFDVRQAVAAIQRANGNLRIEGLARSVGLSQSALERRFRRAVGTSPKQFASIARLQFAVRRYSAGANLSEIAHEAGYFDQPHFVKDFRSFTGQSPELFFKTTPLW